MARYKDIDAIIEQMNGSTAETWGKGLGRSWWSHSVMLKDNIVQLMKDAPEADVVEVVNLSEQIIRKKAEIIDYWKNNVKQYRAMQGYCDIEHDTDNFLRGYNEAVEDMLAILDSARMDGDAE